MEANAQVIAYRLTPVYPAAANSIATAAAITCMATGKMLDGMGGGGLFLSPEVVEMLRGGGCTITKDGAEAQPQELTEAKSAEALKQVRVIAISHSNYGHIEGNRRAFAIVSDIDQRISAIERAAEVANG